MKVLQSSLIRALIAIVVGALLVKYREDTMKWMTVTAGVLFLISGLISCIVYYYERQRINKEQEIALQEETTQERNRQVPLFPFVGAGSVILGIILTMMPTNFILGVAYVLAGILILGAISQLVSLILARKYSTIPFFFWLFPIVTLAVGILVIAKPMETETLPLKIIGWCLMFYGVTECINALKIHSAKKRFMAEEEAKVITGTPVEKEVSSVKELEPIEDAQIIEDDQPVKDNSKE